MKILARLSAVFALALCAGCSSFQEKWDAVGEPGKFQNASRWDGRWESARHKTAANKPDGGRLRCVIEPASDARIVAYFHANWQAFAANYEVIFSPKTPGGQKQDGVMEFRGTHELPKVFGGIYRYDARIASDRFSARYDSSYDSGKFEMTRQLTNATRIH
ncbi:MAG: hypothetical protein ABIZ56_11235 [Chthoniobacteraceae bacterium]